MISGCHDTNTCKTGIGKCWIPEYKRARKKMSENIDRNDTWCVSIDETPDPRDDLSVTVLLFSTDPRKAPKTLEIMLRDCAADNEGVVRLCQRADKSYNLVSDNCSGIALDQAKYNSVAFDKLQITFPYAVCIFDIAHTIWNGIAAAYDLNGWKDGKQYFRKSRAIFVNSLTKKSNFKRFVRRKDVDDNGEMDQALANFLPREAEDVLDAPLMNQSNYDRDILSTLKKAVGYNTYPPKLMKGMNLFTISIISK